VVLYLSLMYPYSFPTRGDSRSNQVVDEAIQSHTARVVYDLGSVYRLWFSYHGDLRSGQREDAVTVLRATSIYFFFFAGTGHIDLISIDPMDRRSRGGG